MKEHLENNTSDDLSNSIVEKEKELRAAMQSLSIVEEEDTRLALEVAKLQLQRKQNQSGIIQGKHNVRRIMSEKRELERRFWDSRNN